MRITYKKPEQPKSFSFTIENEARAKEFISHYPEGRQASAVLPLLDLAQRQSGGWLPKVAMEYVAARLEMPVIKVYEVATFYTMFNLEPVGRYHIQLCRTASCWLRRGAEIAQICEQKLGISLGETTEDGLFTLSEVECLGACANAPVMQVNDDVYEDLTPENIGFVLDELKAGRRPPIGSQQGRACAVPASLNKGEV